TREAKLGCIFTQTKVDEKFNPRRDPDSTTYVGAIETAEEFGRRIYAEAVRRGLTRALKVIVLGDGAPWIWGIAEEHFPGAIQIVDLYHAREHLATLAKIVYEAGSLRWKQWLATRVEELDAGQVEAVALSLRRLRPQDRTVKDQTDKAIDYFQNNRQRMRYADFRRQRIILVCGNRTRPSITSRTTANGCAMPISADKDYSLGRASSRQAAKRSLDNDSSAPECTGPSAAPTLSSRCAVAG